MKSLPVSVLSSISPRVARAALCLAVLSGLAACSGGGSTPQPSRTIGGTVAGLAGGESLQLQDNGGDTVTVNADGTFTFPTAVAGGGAFAITVSTPPTGQSCAVSGGAGTVGGADVTSPVVTCSNVAYALGGSISGLTLPGLVLANGTDTVSVPVGATSFVFDTHVPYTSSYAVTVQASPADTICTVVNGADTMPAGDVSTVTVTCASHAHTISGSISPSTYGGVAVYDGIEVILMGPGAVDFTFDPPLAEGTVYNVTVEKTPDGQTCSVANGAGVMGTTAVTGVLVTCATTAWTVGGTVGGLTASGLVLANDGVTFAVPANAATFTLAATVADTGTYDVTVASNPAGLTCSVANASGTIAAANVSNVAVTCAP